MIPNPKFKKLIRRNSCNNVAGAAYVLIATSTSPVFRTLTKRMELIAEAETCLEKAMREDFGCIIWKGIADYAMVKNLTDKNGHVPLQESTQIALFIGDGLVSCCTI